MTIESVENIVTIVTIVYYSNYSRDRNHFSISWISCSWVFQSLRDFAFFRLSQAKDYKGGKLLGTAIHSAMSLFKTGEFQDHDGLDLNPWAEWWRQWFSMALSRIRSFSANPTNYSVLCAQSTLSSGEIIMFTLQSFILNFQCFWANPHSCWSNQAILGDTVTISNPFAPKR